MARQARGKYLLIGQGVLTRIYTADINGGRFIVVVQYGPTTAPDDLAEFESIIDSIEFES